MGLFSMWLRTILLCLLTTVLGGTWCLEQPGNSCLEYYPKFRDFLTAMFEAFGGSAAPSVKIFDYNVKFLLVPSIHQFHLFAFRLT